MFIQILSAAAFSVLSPAPEPLQNAHAISTPDQERRVAPGVHAAAKELGLRVSLVDAVAAVHRFDRHCLELGLYKSDGALNAWALPRDADPDHPIMRFLGFGEAPGESCPRGGNDASSGEDALGPSPAYPGLQKFHFPGLPPSLDELLECTRYHVGFLAARAAFAADADLDPTHLLAMLSEDCLMAPPIEGSPEALRLHQRSLAQRRFAVLGNGAFCYVAWGFVQMDGFWTLAGEASKDDFIQKVLELAIQSDASSWMCQRVLHPPLVPTGDQPGRGVARPFDPHPGVIGFTDRHQSFVQGVRLQLNAAPGTGESQGSSDSAGASVPRLRAWVSVMLDRILRERGTREMADAALRNGSVEERLQYWNTLVRSVPFEAFNAAYLNELARMAAGTDALPGSERIRDLEALALERELTEDEVSELAGLRTHGLRLRRTLIGKLGELLVASGGPLHVAAVAETLAGPTELLLSPSGGIVPGGMERAALLGNAWTQLGLVASDQTVWVVQDHLGGTSVLPEYALDSMVGLLPLHRPAGFESVLDDVLQSDSLAMQSRAIMNPDWMDEERFRTEFTRLTDASRLGALAPSDTDHVRLNLIGALARRSDGAGRELLLRTFEDGLWKPDADGWASRLSKGPWLKGLWAKLQPGERADFVRRGLAPPRLFD